MKEAWLFRGAAVPVDAETTSALVAEIKRLIDVVGGMALAQSAQRTWVGLTDEEIEDFVSALWPVGAGAGKLIRAIEAKLKEKNT